MKVTNTFNPTLVKSKLRAGLGLLADTAAKQLEEDAKRNAPWVDRTSNARNSIQGSYGWRGNHLVITVSGNMEYSVWLELAREKRYAILVPTIQKNAPAIFKAFRRF